MPRKNRFVIPGHCYHVIIRGVGGRNIFIDNSDRTRFCLLLQYASEIGGLNIHGFCFMSNHVHLLVQPHSEDLATGMHRLSFRYAQEFNKKINHKGYLFQDRYKAIAVEHGEYLLQVIRYIHRNPLRANIVKDLSNYPWSSHQAYLGYDEFTWLKKDLILSHFETEQPTTQSSQSLVQHYHRYMNSNDAEAKMEAEKIRKSTKVGAYGTEIFTNEFLSAIKTDNATLLHDVLTSPNKEQLDIRLDSLIQALKETSNVSLDEIRSSSKKPRLVEARTIFIWLLLRQKLSTLDELAVLLQRDTTTISRLEQRVQNSPQLFQLANAVIAKARET